MTTLSNRKTTLSIALALGAGLLLSTGAAQAGHGHAIGGIKTTGINTVSGGPVVNNRDHRGNHNGEGGVTVTSGPSRHCTANVCATNTSAEVMP